VAEISELIARMNSGDLLARSALFEQSYSELRKLARSRLRSVGRVTSLNTTAVVHESYLRMLGGAPLRSEDQRAFYAYAAQVMRSVIVDTVRERRAERRGGDFQRVTMDTNLGESLPSGESQLLEVHEALELLAGTEPRLAKVVEMRYFGGYTEEEIAQALDVTERTVRRDWDKARLLLMAILQP
jgi:RNA polymerase sigma factor (TIGR02999 family)